MKLTNRITRPTYKRVIQRVNIGLLQLALGIPLLAFGFHNLSEPSTDPPSPAVIWLLSFLGWCSALVAFGLSSKPSRCTSPRNKFGTLKVLGVFQQPCVG